MPWPWWLKSHYQKCSESWGSSTKQRQTSKRLTKHGFVFGVLRHFRRLTLLSISSSSVESPTSQVRHGIILTIYCDLACWIFISSGSFKTHIFVPFSTSTPGKHQLHSRSSMEFSMNQSKKAAIAVTGPSSGSDLRSPLFSVTEKKEKKAEGLMKSHEFWWKRERDFWIRTGGPAADTGWMKGP